MHDTMETEPEAKGMTDQPKLFEGYWYLKPRTGDVEIIYLQENRKQGFYWLHRIDSESPIRITEDDRKTWVLLGMVPDYRGFNLDVQTYADFMARLAESSWDNTYGTVRVGRKYLELHTGGWSENEEAISYLEHTLYWSMCWVRSEKGGHYWLRILKAWPKVSA
jgi:hypothetical protein